MGRAERNRKKQEQDEEEAIRQEAKEYPWLWTKPYVVNLKKRQSETMRKLGFEWERIGWICCDLDWICESAERWQPGAGKIIREQLTKQKGINQ